jgi:SAM-dependent methyltransferase
MLSLYKKILGNPFVYDRIRPLVVGGIDMRRLYELLREGAERRVLDVGCGTGDALRYLVGFEAYLGIDTDPVAVDAARARYGERPGVRFERKMLEPADVEAFAPTAVVLSGVLHHLSDDEAIHLFQTVRAAKSLVRIATSDIVFIPGKHFNNTLARLDRGRHCRKPEGYEALARQGGFAVERSETMSSSPDNDRVRYFVMSLVPRS